MDIKELLKWTFGICVAVITIYKFFWKAPSEKESKDVKQINEVEIKAETIATRFIALFEAHGVHRNQIEEFFGHGLDIPSCATDEELLKKLTPEIITDAVILFGVNKDWLEGSSTEIYDIPDFYKHPEDFDLYLTELLKSTDSNKLSAYALTVNKKSRHEFNDSLFVIAESIGEINQREIYKYHLLGNWGIYYWKSRAYFTACCALLYKHGLSVAGKVVKKDWLIEVCEGTKLLKYDFSERYGGVKFLSVGSWIVSDFVEMPDNYLKGLNTKDGHSVNLALEKWLTLSEKGYMRCFPEDEKFHAGVEAEFNKKLEELA
jgi:hypothetical protein